MKPLHKVILSCVFLVGIPIVWWSLYDAASQTYSFWKDGIEKQATVIALDHTSSLPKGGIVFHYALKIDDHTVVKGLLRQLPVGSSFSVMELSPHPNEDEITIGTKGTGLLSLFSDVVGGRGMAIILVFLVVPCLVITTFMVPVVLRKVWSAK